MRERKKKEKDTVSTPLVTHGELNIGMTYQDHSRRWKFVFYSFVNILEIALIIRRSQPQAWGEEVSLLGPKWSRDLSSLGCVWCLMCACWKTQIILWCPRFYILFKHFLIWLLGLGYFEWRGIKYKNTGLLSYFREKIHILRVDKRKTPGREKAVIEQAQDEFCFHYGNFIQR